jgi:DNA primase catalytic core
MRIQDFENVIEKVKLHLSDYLLEQGIDASKHFLCINPNHNDSVPSCNLVGNGTKTFCHSCSASYDIFDVAQILENKPKIGIEWIEGTLKYLANKYNIEVTTTKMTSEEIYRIDTFRAYKAASKLLSVNNSLVLQKELEKRQWDASKLLEMGIGVVSSYSDFRKALRDEGFTTKFLDEIGLDKKDLFNQDCLIYTWYDEKGRPVGFVGRDILFEEKKMAAEKEGKQYKGSKYTNTRTTEINFFQKGRSFYGIHEAIKHGNPVYIFEGQADVITARMAGINTCIAIGGSTLRDDHIQLLRSLNVYDIVLCFDGDKTGRAKLEQALEDKFAGNKEMKVRVIDLPDGEDPDSYIRKHGKDGFLALACWTAFEWKLNKYDETSDEIDICKAMIPFIVNEPSPVIRDQLVKVLAKRTGVTLKAINQELNLLLDEKSYKRNKERQDILDEAMYQLRNTPSEAEAILQKVQNKLMELVKKHDSDTLSSEDFLRTIDQQKENEEKIIIGDGGFKLGPDLKEVEETFRGDWSKGVFICIGGKANVGKTSLLCKVAHSIANHNEDVVVIYHTIDDTAEQLLPRFITIAEGSRHLSMNMVRQPNYWSKTIGIQDLVQRRDMGYDLIRKLAQDGRLVIKDIQHGCSIPFIENLICYYKDKYPERRVVFILDNFHKLRDFDKKDERVRFKAMSEAIKGITLRHCCCIITSVEYTKLAPGIKPTNHHIGECLLGDTEIFNYETGGYERIDEVKPGMKVLTLDENQRLVPQKVLALIDKGNQEAWKITTKTGRTLTTTMNHPFFSENGWVKLSELNIGDFLGMPRELKSNQKSKVSIPKDLARFLGYMAGDGCYNQLNNINQTPSFTNSCEEYLKDVEDIVKKNFQVIVHKIKDHDSFTLRFSRINGTALENPIVSYLKKEEIHNQKKEQKRLPKNLMTSSNETKTHYIAGLFAADGCVSKGNRRVSFTNISQYLIFGCQRLLLHLGIQSYINGPDKDNVYRLNISNKDIPLFRELIPIIGYKKEELDNYLETQTWQITNTGDFLPATFTKLVKEKREASKKPVRYNDGYYIQKEKINRRRAQIIADEMQDSEIKIWAYSDVFWDQIKSIEYIGKRQMWDLSVEQTHNFIANDIFCHNSGQMEYDASAIIHIYNEVSDKPDQFTVCHEDTNWNGEKQFLPRLEFIVGKNKISDIKKSFFLDFWPASSDFKRIDQNTVLQEAQAMKNKPKDTSGEFSQFNQAIEDLEGVY